MNKFSSDHLEFGDYYDIGFISQCVFPFFLSVKVISTNCFQQDWSRVKQIAKVILWHMHTRSTMSNKPKNDNHSKVKKQQQQTFFRVCHAIGNFCHGNTNTQNVGENEK